MLNTSYKEQTLSPGQYAVLKLIADGQTNKEIAVLLKISVRTVEVHRAMVMQKLDIHTIVDLVKYAIRQGMTKL